MDDFKEGGKEITEGRGRGERWKMKKRIEEKGSIKNWHLKEVVQSVMEGGQRRIGSDKRKGEAGESTRNI